ncbi:MAG: bifunctional molybdenum cofactor biosynthesis protein MoaC/MoaB [Saprospiraceae bacterium]|nr:bifunctional molybdenum cofactor biosynthesis protein MoaC/MoaB [Saprospiraceae bacterium]
MVDITHKIYSQRIAIAQAIVRVGSEETIAAILEHRVPKGDVLTVARTAGLFAAKKTSDMIPDCHPLPIEFTKIDFEIGKMEIKILVEIKTIYKTGVEVEAMHASSVVALTMYDMLKPIDKNVSIQDIKLLEKKGGKSDLKSMAVERLSVSIVVCSDSVSAGNSEDKSGPIIQNHLRNIGMEKLSLSVVPDHIESIQDRILEAVSHKVNLVLLTGGTGLSSKDLTPEAIEPMLHKRIPGIEETLRAYGQNRMPYAMLSRSIAGLIDRTLVIAMPGSPAAVKESMDCIFPQVLHLFKVMEGERHFE